jgi:hypothetical protein
MENALGTVGKVGKAVIWGILMELKLAFPKRRIEKIGNAIKTSFSLLKEI